MDEDLDMLVLLAEEFDQKIGSADVNEGLASPDEEDVYYEQSDDFNFAAAIFVVE